MAAALLLVGCASDALVDDAVPTTAGEPGPTSTSGGGAPLGQRVEVVEVVDGDTLDVRLPDGRTERVRLLGINAPEATECFSDEATAELERLVGGREVALVADQSDRDRFGRLLRYVEVGGDDVGAALVAGGFALVRVSEPDVARQARLRQEEERARRATEGLWNPSACGPPLGESVDLSISALRLDADGDDAQNLNDEWVEVRNDGSAPVGLSGWVVRDESSSHRFTFPNGFTLASGSTVRIRSGCGTGSAAELFWCASGSAIWNNDGDTAFLLDPAGNMVARLAR